MIIPKSLIALPKISTIRICKQRKWHITVIGLENHDKNAEQSRVVQRRERGREREREREREKERGREKIKGPC